MAALQRNESSPSCRRIQRQDSVDMGILRQHILRYSLRLGDVEAAGSFVDDLDPREFCGEVRFEGMRAKYDAGHIRVYPQDCDRSFAMQNESNSLGSNPTRLVLIIENVGKLSSRRDGKGRADNDRGNATGNHITNRYHQRERLIWRKHESLRSSIDCLFDDFDLL